MPGWMEKQQLKLEATAFQPSKFGICIGSRSLHAIPRHITKVGSSWGFWNWLSIQKEHGNNGLIPWVGLAYVVVVALGGSCRLGFAMPLNRDMRLYYILIFVIKSEELGIAHVAIQCVPAQKLWQRTEYDAVPARPNASIETWNLNWRYSNP